MIKETDKFLILGYGQMGKDVAAFFTKKKINFDIFDDSNKNDSTIELKNIISNNYNFLVKSPGIKNDHILVKLFNDDQVINDMDILDVFKLAKTQIICITGTNGKTTIVQLVSDYLIKLGYISKPCGNYGISPLCYLFENLDFLVIELSSFQLDTIKNFHIDAGIILNISPDHLDFHGTFEKYMQSKLKMYSLSNGNIISLIKENGEEIEKPLIIQKFEVNKKFNPKNIYLVNEMLIMNNIETSMICRDQYDGRENLK